MRYGETGVHLEIDLSRGSIEREETDPKLAELFLGGKGTNIKMLWDRVPPEVEPFSPDNVLIFSPGFLVGTPIPGANRTCVSTGTSPYMWPPMHSYAIFGGFWGAELKHAGYDAVIIRGKSPTPVYLWINDDKVEIRDASHLWGITTVEVEDLLRKELDEPKTQVACIGPAGENRVYLATIEHSGSSASHGQGVIMGDKKLKAIAVRGTKDINIAKPAELIKLCEWALGKGLDKKPWDQTAYRRRARSRVENYAEFYPIAMRGAARGEGRTVTEEWSKEDREYYYTVEKRKMACYNCPVACRAVISLPGRPMSFTKCASLIGGMGVTGGNREFALQLHNRIAQRQGVMLGGVISFALKLREAGILGEENFVGMPSDPKEQYFWLADKICRREGIGDVLANGTYLAAQQIGKGAEKFVEWNIKGVDQGGARVRTFNPTYFIMFATGDKSSIIGRELWFPQRTGEKELATREAREAYIKEGWWDLPERLQKWFLDWDERKMRRTDPEAIEEACITAGYTMYQRNITDSVGICNFWAGWEHHPPYNMHKMANFISYVTGVDVDEPELVRKGKRIDTLVRAYNVRHGLRRKDDRVSHTAVYRDEDYPMEAKCLDEYYKYCGWNLGGIPTKETLEELGLDYVREDLERRGLLAEEVALAYYREDLKQRGLLTDEKS